MGHSGVVTSLPKSVVFSLPSGAARQGGIIPTTLTLSGVLPNGDQATDYSGFLSISGGTAPYLNPTVVAGVLPVDFSLSISGSQLLVNATAIIAFSGTVTCTLDVQDTAGNHAQLPVTFIITAVGFLVTESGNYISTEDGTLLITET